MPQIKKVFVVTVCCVLMALAVGVFAQARPDFSGKYARHVEKFHSVNKVGTATIEISQTPEVLRLKYTEDGKSRIRKLKLDGSEVAQSTPMGTMKESVKFEGKSLVITSVLPGTAEEPGGVQRDEWQLSGDSKTLTMHSVLRVEGKSVHEETRVYTKVVKPVAVAEGKNK